MLIIIDSIMHLSLSIPIPSSIEHNSLKSDNASLNAVYLTPTHCKGTFESSFYNTFKRTRSDQTHDVWMAADVDKCFQLSDK